MSILNYDESRLRKQVDEVQRDMVKRHESARKQNIRMFIVGLTIGIIGTGASMVGLLLALKII